jgi:hypothetical protein
MDHTKFTKTLGDEKKIDLWNTALQKSKAVIAGGGVLAPYAGYARNDLDIYVGKENLLTLCNNLVPLGVKSDVQFDGLSTIYLSSKKLCFCSGYDKSFFRKNNLLARIRVRVPRHIEKGTIVELLDPSAPRKCHNLKSTYRVSKIYNSEEKSADIGTASLKGVPYFRSEYDEYTPEDRNVPMRELVWQDVDIIVVDTEKTTIEEVVSNFDLSFCEIWYDGSGIKLGKTNKEEILQKKGFLQGEYVQSLVNGNTFIMSRLEKYKSRGFSIGIKPDKDISYECPSMTKDVENLDAWASYFTYTYLLMSTSILITMGTPSRYLESHNNIEIRPLLELISASASPGSFRIVRKKTVSTCLAILIAQPHWKKNRDGDCDNEGGCIVELIRMYAPDAMKPLEEDMSRKDKISAIAKILQDKYSTYGDGYDFLLFYQFRCFGIYLQTYFGTSTQSLEDSWYSMIIRMKKRSLQPNWMEPEWMDILFPPAWRGVGQKLIHIQEQLNEQIRLKKQEAQIRRAQGLVVDDDFFYWYHIPGRPYSFNVKNALYFLFANPSSIKSKDVSQVHFWKIRDDIWKLHKKELQYLYEYPSETELNTKDGPPFVADIIGIEEPEKQEKSDITKRIVEINDQIQIAQRDRNISEVRRLMKERNDLQQAQKPVVDSGFKGLTIDRYINQPVIEGYFAYGFFTFITIGPDGQYQAWGSSIGTLFHILIDKESIKDEALYLLYQEFKDRITSQEFDQNNKDKCIKLLDELTIKTIPKLDKVLVKCGSTANRLYPSYDQMVDGYKAIWYAKIDIGPAYSAGIPYDSLKAIIKYYIYGYRVFMLSGETNLEEVSTVSNLMIGPDAYNLSNAEINTTSGIHCNNIGHVYTNVTIFMHNNEPPSFHVGNTTVPMSNIDTRDLTWLEDYDTEESKEDTNNSEEKSADRNVTIGRARGRARAARLRSVAEEGDVVDEYRSGDDSLAEGASIDEETESEDDY